MPESAEEIEDFYVQKPTKKTHSLRSVSQHKKQGQDAWLALFSIVDTKEQRKRILDAVSTVAAPWFLMPELLSDFLTNCYNTGGSMSLLALSGVFYLIQKRNLDYPSFYPKLYSLLNRDILHSKYRSRFFRLLDTFLASTHLPATLVASFVKRLSRLSLNAPPSAVAFLIPWIYNILKRHPQCTFMIHRESKDGQATKAVQENGLEDPFLADEADPMQTNAIDSSLWELVQLQSHYHPNVATITKILSEQFTKQSYNIEDFLDHSYASVSASKIATKETCHVLTLFRSYLKLKWVKMSRKHLSLSSISPKGYSCPKNNQPPSLIVCLSNYGISERLWKLYKCFCHLVFGGVPLWVTLNHNALHSALN